MKVTETRQCDGCSADLPCERYEARRGADRFVAWWCADCAAAARGESEGAPCGEPCDSVAWVPEGWRINLGLLVLKASDHTYVLTRRTDGVLWPERGDEECELSLWDSLVWDSLVWDSTSALVSAFETHVGTAHDLVAQL